jgi:hypothetical protein
MTQTTLKQHYQNKKITEVKSKLKLIDETLKSSEEYQVAILLEALDADEYKQATEVIEKLQKISDTAKNAGMDLLTGAIDQIVKQINEFTGGGGLTRFKGNIASLFSKTPAKNPILAGLAMVGALEAGFKILPTILKNNIKDIEKDNEKQGMKLIELIQDDDKLKKNVENSLTKAFIPAGTFGKVFGKIPGIDTNKLVQDLFNATPVQLGEISKVLNSGTTVADVDPKLASPEEAGGEAPSQDKQSGGEPSKQQQQQNIKITQAAAQKAGISNGKALLSLFDELGFKLGTFEGNLVVPELQKLQRKFNIPDDQTDGFIRGLMVDFEKDFKVKLQDQIKKEVERLKKDQEKGATQAQPATT